MKDITPKDLPEVSGGYTPEDDGCFPPFPVPFDYPPTPIGPFPDPVPGPVDPSPLGRVK